jgi:hypothetical protein
MVGVSWSCGSWGCVQQVTRVVLMPGQPARQAAVPYPTCPPHLTPFAAAVCLRCAAVNQVLMSSDGRLVVTLSKDTTCRIWDAQTGDCLHVLQGAPLLLLLLLALS